MSVLCNNDNNKWSFDRAKDKRWKRDHTEGEIKRKGEQCLTGPLLFMVKRNASLFSVSDVDWHTGFQLCRPAVQATRPSNIHFFQRQKGERERERERERVLTTRLYLTKKIAGSLPTYRT